MLVWWQAKINNGEIVLRIDDHDETRVRDEYLEDLFEVLKWLGLDWDEGPKSAKEHKETFSQSLRKDVYKKEVLKLGDTFWCECSRKDLERFGGIYPGTCRHKGLKPDGANQVALRLNTDKLSLQDESFKDFILWRKDDLPSYQWVSLFEDKEMKISHVVRGEDLKGSTDFQKSLAHFLKWPFPKHIYHHPLLKKDGEKISKATKASSLFEEFNSPQEFYKEIIADFFARNWGEKQPIEGPADLLKISRNLFD